MAIEWTQAISVGDKTIDEQHKKLLTQINKLIEAMSSGAGPEIVGDTISYIHGTPQLPRTRKPQTNTQRFH